MDCLYYLEKHHLLFLETSALESTNVEAAFNTVLTGNSGPLQTYCSRPNKKNIPVVVSWAVWVTCIFLCLASLLPLMSFPPGGNSWQTCFVVFWCSNICATLSSQSLRTTLRLLSILPWCKCIISIKFPFHRDSQEGGQQGSCAGPHQRLVLEQLQSRKHRGKETLLQEHLITRSLMSPGAGELYLHQQPFAIELDEM